MLNSDDKHIKYLELRDRVANSLKLGNAIFINAMPEDLSGLLAIARDLGKPVSYVANTGMNVNTYRLTIRRTP